MDDFDKSHEPKFLIREIAFSKFVIDVHWPYGSVEQLVGIFISRDHAAHWLLSGGSDVDL